MILFFWYILLAFSVGSIENNITNYVHATNSRYLDKLTVTVESTAKQDKATSTTASSIKPWYADWGKTAWYKDWRRIVLVTCAILFLMLPVMWCLTRILRPCYKAANYRKMHHDETLTPIRVSVYAAGSQTTPNPYEKLDREKLPSQRYTSLTPPLKMRSHSVGLSEKYKKRNENIRRIETYL